MARKITHWNFILWIAMGAVILISFINFGLWARNEIVKWQRSPIEQEIAYWENVVRDTPTYRDGYLKLATLYWQLGKNQKTQDSLEKAKLIDPNYEATKKLQEQLKD